MDIQELRRKYERKVGQKDQLKRQITETQESIKKTNKRIQVAKRAIDVIKVVALETQGQLEYRIASTVSAAQQAVFENPYNLVARFEEKRGKTECRLLFERDKLESDPLASSGYGAVDIAAFALRTACWSMSRNTRPVMILDEPFKHLKGIEENKRAILMMKEISKELGLQIITISDERANKEDIMEGADKLFQVNIKNKVSRVEKSY